MLNRKQRFATKGFRIRRLNPDGTRMTKSRMLGFFGTADLSAVTTLDVGSLTVKIDGVVDTNDVDFSAAADISAVTVAEAVTALTAAGFAGVTWSADASTGRLLGVAAAGVTVQVYGAIAAALDFGQGVDFGGQGCLWYKFFDNSVVSIGLPKNIKDKEEIDSEDANGVITRMIIGAKMLGISPAIVLKKKDYDVLELIQGGTYDRTANTYDPPLSDETEHPMFEIEVFSPIYDEGTNKAGDMSGYEQLLLRSCIGMEGDVPIEAKAWAQYAYNVESTDYKDATGVIWPSYQEATLTVAAFDTLNPVNE